MLLVIYDTEKCLEMDLFYLEIMEQQAKGRWLRHKHLPSSMCMVLVNANIRMELIKNSTCSIRHAMINIGRYLCGESNVFPLFLNPSLHLSK